MKSIFTSPKLPSNIQILRKKAKIPYRPSTVMKVMQHMFVPLFFILLPQIIATVSSSTTTTSAPTTTTKRPTPTCGPNHDYVLKGYVDDVFYNGDTGGGVICYIAMRTRGSLSPNLNKLYHACSSQSLCDYADREKERGRQPELWGIFDEIRGIPVVVGMRRPDDVAHFPCIQHKNTQSENVVK
ncbi:uncharacterized protein LOC135841713 [Planococcus citri]|uniref:uncharacterized protein LOC135841713 n=1 Tax=Planococcus citri TaxID=170843 RepID=UPI0031F77394